MGFTKQIPNILTLLNLFCGAVAVLYAVESNFLMATLFMFAGIFFDFFDGFAARLLNARSPLGLQLDSLADMVTSGLVPGIVMFKLLAFSMGLDTTDSGWSEAMVWNELQVPLLSFLGLGITLASGYRLAKFNIDEDQQSYFKGLPTPANAIFIMSFPLILEFQSSAFLHQLILNSWFLLGITLLSCYLLNSKIKLFALKFSDWSFKTNAVRYIFLILVVVLLALVQFIAIPLLILTYILLSLFANRSIS